MADRVGIPHRAVNVTEGELRSADRDLAERRGSGCPPSALLDGRRVGDGEVGPLYRKVREAFEQYKRELAPKPW